MSIDIKGGVCIPVTQQDIARHVGVSRSTVAQVMTGTGRVQDETRARVLEAARELNYRPNALAQAMVTGQTGNLAFWYSPSLDPHSAQIINDLDRRVAPYRLSIRNVVGRQPVTGGLPSKFSPDEFPPAEWPVDGIFALSIGALPDYLVRDNRVTTPLVSMVYDAFSYRPPAFVDTITIRIAPACEEAMRHLVATRQRVALLCVESMPLYNDVRLATYTRAMEAAGRAPELILAPLKKPWRLHACQTVRDYVRANGCPDAIFCGNDEQATGAHTALHELGYVVPDDVALIGNDGLEETEYRIVPLSTIAQPYEEIAEIAWQFLSKRIKEPDAPRQYAEVDAKLLLRESSAARKK